MRSVIDLAITPSVSWLKAVNIPVEPLKDALLVICKDGRKLKIVFQDTGEGFFVNPKQLGSYNLDIALNAFYSITTAAGYGKPLPVNRGHNPTKDELYKYFYNDFFLQSVRHRELRSSPNLSKEKQQQYGKVIEYTSRKLHYKYNSICKIHGYEVEDLHTYCWLWACEFAHRYELVEPSRLEDNRKLLTKYLHNRFHELQARLYKRQPQAHAELKFDPINPDDDEYDPEFESKKTKQLRKKFRSMNANAQLSALNIVAESTPVRDIALDARRKIRKMNHAIGNSKAEQ